MTIQPLDALADAIAAIVEQNNALIATVSGLAAAYRGCAPMPARPGRLSALLNCETNGAHIHLEAFAHAAKAIPRGDIPHERLDAFLVSCGDLVETLIQVLADNPDALGALYDVSREETRFMNFLKGVSGADVNLPPTAYALRIDLFIRDLKDAFAKLGRALVYFEYHLTRPRPESPPENQAVIAECRRIGRRIAETRNQILEHLPDDDSPKAIRKAMRERALYLIKQRPDKSIRNICQIVVEEYRGIPGAYASADVLRRALARQKT